MGVLILLIFLGLVLAGMPIAYALGIAGAIGIYQSEGGDALLSTIPQQLFSQLNSFTLLTIPLFILAGAIMAEGGVAERLMNFAQVTIGRGRGGLGVAIVVSALFFHGISGSSTADTAAIGRVTLPILKRQGYPLPFSAALLASAGATALLVPPAVDLIIVGVVANISIAGLFAGGVIPAIVNAMGLIVWTVYQARKHGYGGKDYEKNLTRRNVSVAVLTDDTAGDVSVSRKTGAAPGVFSWAMLRLRTGGPSTRAKTELEPRGLGRSPSTDHVLRLGPVAEILLSFLKAIPALLMIVIILGGIFLGIFTPTEASVVAVVYGLFVSMVVYRELKPSGLATVFVGAVELAGLVMLVIAMGSILSYAFTINQVPDEMAHWIAEVAPNKYVFLLLVQILFFLIGMVMDGVPAELILMPILTPIAIQYGIDPIHFGILVVANIGLGLAHPPVGLCLNTAAAVANIPVEKVIRPLLPFMAIQWVTLLIITYVEGLTTFLPNLLGLGG
jgi:TRAP-type C4-dicarboxylate transport system permease large subunit